MNESVKNVLRHGRWWMKSALGKDYYHRPQVRRPVTKLGGRSGTGFGAWATYTAPLRADSIVYSVGVGDDISFDRALIEQFGLVVHAIDPTPAAIAWLSTQHVPEGFVLHPYALGARDGVASFHAHANPDWISHSIFQTTHTTPEAIEVPMRRLSSLMEMLGHTHIDLLKIDIEGAEYEVIEDLAAQRIPVDQLLVEFHHRFDGLGPDHTRKAVARLNEAGFRSFYVTANGEEYSFVRV